jgi:hypothetical protein
MSEATAILGPAATVLPPDDGAASGDPDRLPRHIVPIRPGSVATAAFVDSGVKLTSDDRMYSAD